MSAGLFRMDYVIISGTYTTDWCNVVGTFTTKAFVKMLVSVSTMDIFMSLVWIVWMYTHGC